MNKKFSTLAVAAMLASAFTAYAGPGEVVTQLAEGNNGKQYQLRAIVNTSESGTPSWKDQGYLILDEKDGTLSFNADLKDVKGVSVLGKSLWCVDVTLENQGKNPIFDFINKGVGSILDVTVGGWSEDATQWAVNDEDNPTYWINNDPAHVGGEVRGWEFTPVLGNEDRAVYMFDLPAKTDADDQFVNDAPKEAENFYSLNSYISSTHVATLVWDSKASEIRVAVVKADKISEIENKQVKFFLQEAYPVDLTAAQFNSILNTQKPTETVKMTFDKDYNNTDIINLLSTNEFNALDALSWQDCSEGETCKLGDAKEHNFVFLYKTEADGTRNYLRVDTAYANGYGTKFLTFAFESFKNNAKPDNTTDGDKIIPNQYKFRLNYCPTNDSLSIQVMSALYKLQDDGKPWRTLVAADAEEKGYAGGLKTNEEGYGTKNTDYVVTNWNDSPVDGTPNPSGMKIHYTNWVKLQDLELSTESRIITIGDAPINTHISFGYGDCSSVVSEYTSVADGVYYIKNAKGQYLAHPIYNNGQSAPFFVTVSASEQEVAHMPAYQWVVLKKYTDTEAAQATSPVLIANREFDETFEYDAQLKQAAGAQYMYLSSDMKSTTKWYWEAEDGSQYYPTVLSKTDSLQFVAVPTESVEDQYLGYKKIDADSLLVNKYTFNYWHPYATDKFIAKSDKDSTLTVLNGKDAFTIKEINSLIGYDKNNTAHKSSIDIPYGFATVADEEGNVVEVNGAKMTIKDLQKRIPGLAQLKRTVYEVYRNAPYWKVNDNDQFNVGADKYNYSNWDQSGERYFAFFKENNHVGGQDYYAIVRATIPNYVMGKNSDNEDVFYYLGEYDFLYQWEQDGDNWTIKRDANGKKLLANPTEEYVINTSKAGVSDYDGAATLKNQPLIETRTSSFAIERDDTPLYRRFNSTLEGVAGDGADTLRFYEKYRNEYLMIEANPSFMVEHIDFLGINAQDKADGGLAFIVDTAWVNRGAGSIKPQYLISIDRHDFAGTPGIPCTYEHNHFDNKGNAVDAAHCSHATPAIPGFARGKYLINFHNFANSNEMVGADKYKWAEYDRAGFKEAIIVKDTMYILRDEFKNLSNEEIDLAKLASAEVEALRAWTNAGKADQNAQNFLSYRYELTGDNHKYVTWSMRFFDRSVAANEVEADRAFLFESMKSLTKASNDNHYVANGSSDVHDGIYVQGDAEGDVAPTQAAWLKMQNGCLVLSDENSKFNEVTTGSDDALIFNVEHVDGDKLATDNEAINVEGVKVIAGDGQVTIMGAAGKNVTITTVLGKTVVAKAIASDNETIAVPTTGIVAVAVEGEEAIMTIVK